MGFQVFEEPVYCAGSPCDHAVCRACLLFDSGGTSWSETTDDCELHVEDCESSPRSQDRHDDLNVERLRDMARCPVCDACLREQDLRPHQVLECLTNEVQ